jgi:hypothetical protein
MKNTIEPIGNPDDIKRKTNTKYTLLYYHDLFLAENQLEKQLFSGKISIKDYLKSRKLLKQISQD